MQSNSLSSSFVTSSLNTGIDRESREGLSDYVANLHLHMALQSRNLVPHLGFDRPTGDSRSQLLQETQAEFEKFASRQ